MPRPVERLVIMCIACLSMHPSHGKDPVPDGDFLEYLGQMVEEDGEYLDLMDLAEVQDMPETTGNRTRNGAGDGTGAESTVEGKKQAEASR